MFFALTITLMCIENPEERKKNLNNSGAINVIGNG